MIHMSKVRFVFLLLVMVLNIAQSVSESETKIEDRYLGEMEHLEPGDVGSDSVRGVPPELEERQMRFSPPQLSDEEERSPHLPEYLLCDGCIAVATQLDLAFRGAHKHVPMTRDLAHWDVIE